MKTSFNLNTLSSSFTPNRAKAVVSLMIAIFLFASGCSRKEASAPPKAFHSCGRIISMSPSLTETLYAIGLGESVAGVTRFCVYPPEAAQKPKIGGFYDVSYESMLALKPDLVILLPEHETHSKRLAELGTPTHTVKQRTIAEIIASMEEIGRLCGVETAARAAADKMKAELRAVGERTKGRVRPKTLVIVGREAGAGGLKNVFVSGANTFYDDLINLAGGQNAYGEAETKVRYPTLSAEGIIALNPQVVIEMVPDLAERGLSEEDLLKDWAGLTMIEAVKKSSIYVFSEDFVSIPGPRATKILLKMAKAIHPKADWSDL